MSLILIEPVWLVLGTLKDNLLDESVIEKARDNFEICTVTQKYYKWEEL